MQLALDEEQIMLKNSVARMMGDLVENGDDASARQKAMADFGLFQIGISDGMEVEGALVAEAVGATLLPDPYSFAQLGAATTLHALGGQTQLLARIGDGSALVLPALTEPGNRYALEPSVTTLANGVLSGTKSVVLCANEATHFLVSAQNGADTCLLLFPADANGITQRNFPGLDGRDGADLVFDAATVTPEQIVAQGATAKQAIADLVNRVSAALTAEAVGAMGALMQMTTEFLGMRRQFGVPIGTFQTLQHRLVDMNTSFQLARSMSIAAALALRDLPAVERQTVISSACLQAAESGRHIGEEAIQLHGAMGMTEEYPAGRYFKRLIALAALYGDTDFHLDRLTSRIAG